MSSLELAQVLYDSIGKYCHDFPHSCKDLTLKNKIKRLNFSNKYLKLVLQRIKIIAFKGNNSTKKFKNL